MPKAGIEAGTLNRVVRASPAGPFPYIRLVVLKLKDCFLEEYNRSSNSLSVSAHKKPRNGGSKEWKNNQCSATVLTHCAFLLWSGMRSLLAGEPPLVRFFARTAVNRLHDLAPYRRTGRTAKMCGYKEAVFVAVYLPPSRA